MAKFYNTDIVFSEVPNEVTLAINITNCPIKCRGCHSTHLQENIGIELTEEELNSLIKESIHGITCVCFMGGDAMPLEVSSLAAFVRKNYPGLKIAWYSGRKEIDKDINLKNFDFIKVGPYIEECGPINKKTTNQRLYHVLNSGELEDITFKFWVSPFEL